MFLNEGYDDLVAKHSKVVTKINKLISQTIYSFRARWIDSQKTAMFNYLKRNNAPFSEKDYASLVED